MTQSDSPSAVLRNWSLAMRLILIPAIACSTRTRTRASFRLRRFSHGGNACFRGFFSAANAALLGGDSLGSLGRSGGCSPEGNGSPLPQPSLCRAWTRVWSGSESLPVYSWWLRPRYSYRNGPSSSRWSAGPVFAGFSGAGGSVRPHPRLSRAASPAYVPAGRRGGPRVLGSRLTRPAPWLRPATRTAAIHWRSTGSSQTACRGPLAGDRSWCRPRRTTTCPLPSLSPVCGHPRCALALFRLGRGLLFSGSQRALEDGQKCLHFAPRQTCQCK